MIGEMIGKGSFGLVYAIIDQQKPSRPLVVKIAEDTKSFKREVKTMIKVFKSSKKGRDSLGRVPYVKAIGKIILIDDIRLHDL